MQSEEPSNSLQQAKVTENSNDLKIDPHKKKQKRKGKTLPIEGYNEKYLDNAIEELKENLNDTNSTEEKFEDLDNLTDILFKDFNTVYTNVNLDHKNVAKLFNVNSKISKFFVVDEEVFLDLGPTMISDEQYCDYSLYKVMKTESADMHEQDDDLTEEDLMEDLFVTLETTQNQLGVIINSNVYLTYEQWNTIRLLDKDIFSCSVCQLQCDSTLVPGHMGSITHERKLSEHLPLKRFDLSITRKVKENFHCAVCNVIYPIKNYRDHENSKTHEGNLLFAINKVSDLFWSSGNKITQTLNTNNIQEPNNAPRNIGNIELSRNTELSRNNDFSGNNYFTNTDSFRVHSVRNSEFRNIEVRNSLQKSDGDSRTLNTNNIQPNNTPRNIGNMELFRNNDLSGNNDSFRNSEVRNTLPKSEYSFSFGEDTRSEHQFNFRKGAFDEIKIYEEDDFEEYTLPIEGVSYASMASKPRLTVPKFLKIDLGTKEVRVKFECWNMITQTDLNNFYCMVCKESFLIRFKNQHCMSEVHRMSLAKCAVVGAFEDYLIREVSDKLYHCGHCNNLQYKNDIQVHVEKYHPIKNLKPGADKIQTPLRISQDETYEIPNINTDENTGNNVPVSTVSPEELRSLMKANLDMFGEFKFCPFGTEIVVSNLSYHTLMLDGSKYQCALCNICVVGDLKDHVYEMAHMQFINMTPLIRPFQSNLTRAIRGSLHCAICNILIPVAGMYDHNISPPHTSALARALGMVKSERPRQEVKYQFEGPTEFKTAFDKFLFALPANSRDALSKLQIKNHKGEPIDLSDVAGSSSVSSNSTPKLMSLCNSPVHVKREDTKKQDVSAMTDPSLVTQGATEINPFNFTFDANIKGQFNGASNTKSPVHYNTSNLKGPSFNNASSLKGLAINDTTNLTGHPLKYGSNWQGFPLNSNLKGQPNDASHTKGLTINDASNTKGLASNIKGLAINDASNTKGPASNIKGLASNYANMNSPRHKHIETIESGLPRVGAGAQFVDFRPLQVQITGPLGLNMDPGCIPVSPVIRAENVGTHELLSPYNQKKVFDKVETLTDMDTTKKGKKGDGKDTERNPEIIQELIVESDDEEISAPFKLDETVLLKLKSSYFKVTNTSYQSLVHLGNGARYCFVCSNSLDYCLLQKHVDSRQHIDNISKNKFLHNFCGPLFRQMYLMYHCAICNVTMSRKEVKIHVEWPTHIEKYDQACKKLNKKVRKFALKSGAKEYCLETQKEFLYVNIPEPTISIVTYVQSTKEDFEETFVEKKLVRKSQMIIFKGNMMKICFEAWHGVAVVKGGAKCIICQVELTEDALPRHLETKYHSIALGMTFEKQFYPALIRKINENTVNCVICNIELPNDDSLVFEHINGRKHDKNHSIIVEKTSHTDSYSDCYPYPITL